MTISNIFDIKRFAVHDGPGIRTTMFLKGCPLKCRWCHNPESISALPQLAYYQHKCINCGSCVEACTYGAHDLVSGKHSFLRQNCVNCGKCAAACPTEALKYYGKSITAKEAAEIALQDKAFYQNSGGGVTVSGGEPLLQPEFVKELFTLLKAEGIHTAVDTSGCVPWENIAQVMNSTDLFLYDLKHSDPKMHKVGTGKDNALVLDNLSRLSVAGKLIEVRIPLITGLNDNIDNLNVAGQILSGIKTITKIVVLPYNSFATVKYEALGMENAMPECETQDDETLNLAVNIIAGYGLRCVSGRE